MESRFGFKDFVQAVLLLAILGSIWLAMKQYDRQWDQLDLLHADLKSLTANQNRLQSQLDQLKQKLDEGVTVGSVVKPPAGQPTPPITGTVAPPNDKTALGPTITVGPADNAKTSFTALREARAKPDFAEGDVLVDAFGTNIKAVTALVAKDAYGRRIQSVVLEPLVIQDDDTLEWLPHIARSWEIEDNSKAYNAYLTEKTAKLNAMLQADPSVLDAMKREMIDALKKAAPEKVPAPGSDADKEMTEKARQQWIEQQIRDDKERPPAMAVTFHLRDDVRFSDGVPLTARDVEFSWRLLNNSLVNAPETRNFYDNVETYKALDDATVRFTMREPNYLAFSMVGAFSVLPEHFYGKISVDDLNKKPGLLLGSGPYRLESPTGWVPGTPMKLMRNENYWGPKPAFGALVWREIEKDLPRLIAFKNGEIDLFSATPEQYVKMKDDPEVLKTNRPWEFMAIPSGYSFIAWNQKRDGKPTKFADARVRRAMTLLIDRQRLVHEVSLGLGVVANGPFDAGSKQADPKIEAWPFDPKAALTLLAECGWKPGADGVLRNAAGEPFAFTLTYPSGNDTYERIMLILKDTFNRHGVLMTQDPQEWSVFIERVDGRVFDACSLAWGGGAIEGDIRQMFHSSQIANGANNFTHYINPKLDALIDDARRTIDEGRRMKLWQACHDLLHEDQPYTFLMRRKTLLFINKRVENVHRVLTGLNGRTEWYVPGPEQVRKP